MTGILLLDLFLASLSSALLWCFTMTELYYPGKPYELALTQKLIDDYTKHPEERGLISEIDYDRLNDFPKLMYADWLRERSDSRAEAWDWIVSIRVYGHFEHYQSSGWFNPAEAAPRGRYFLRFPKDVQEQVKAGKLKAFTNIRVLLRRDRHTWLSAILDAVDSYGEHMRELEKPADERRAGIMQLCEQPWMDPESEGTIRMGSASFGVEWAVKAINAFQRSENE